jgi:NADH-quinone oxidoreductase subunit L
MWFLEHAYYIPLIPAVAFFIIILFGKRLPMKGSEIGILSMLGSLTFAVGMTYQWIQRVDGSHEVGAEGAHRLVGSFGRALLPRAEEAHASFVAPVIKTWTWWQSGGTLFKVGTHIDGLSVMVLLLVAFISTLVQLYSMEYLKGDRRYTHFFAALTLFSAGMLAMVAADNLVIFLLGWEIMGLCSFMLIGHWWEDGANSKAALKAFFTVRTGDIGLLVGIAILFGTTKTFSIQKINEMALSGSMTHTQLFWASMALLVAIIGKSGQFPLHTWLPDAMAGPTPVSSLLHSSTMVVAGVFLGARLYPVFWEGFNIADGGWNPMALIGGITIVIAALLAFVQNDIKKVLAYSTVSQLGYMVMGLGVGAWTPAVFHIFTHAFFKCCLFLGAGSISHSASHHSFDMKKDMGGLRKHMPITFITFVVSTAALAGIPFTAGFFSKDEIIDNAGHNGYKMFMYVGLVGAFMTAAYMMRCVYLTFFGEPRGASAGEHHDEHTEHANDAHAAHVAADAHGHDVHAAADPHGHDAHAPVLAMAHAGHDAHGDAHANDGHGDDHAGPHESPWRITFPLVLLATLAIAAGYLNAAPFHIEKFKEWVEPSGQVFTAKAEGESHEGESHSDESHEGDEPAATETAEARIVGGAGAALRPMAEEEPEGEGTAAGGEGGEAKEAGCGRGLVPPSGEACAFPAVDHAPFKWINTVPSIALVFAGLLISFFVSKALYSDKRAPFFGLTQRAGPLRAGYNLLWNKYYLDHLYENIIVRGIVGPIAKAAVWFNQHILDGIVNGLGLGSTAFGRWTYKYVDQGVIDGAVNGSGKGATSAGGGLRFLQTGRIQQYAALLFGAAALGALALVIFVQA